MCNEQVIQQMSLLSLVCKLSANRERACVSICYLELLSKWVMSANCCQCFTGRFFTTTITLNICSLCNQLLALSTSSPKSRAVFPLSLPYQVSRFPCQQGTHKTTIYFWHQQFIITSSFCKCFRAQKRAHNVPRKRTKMEQILSKSLAAFI